MSASEKNRAAGVFRGYLREALVDMHIHVPARVTKVDYNKGFINATPLIKIKYNDAKVVKEAEILDIPITFMEFDGGSAVMTFPIKAGDKVYVVMSDRDTANLINSDGGSVVVPESSSPFGVYPIGCLPFHTFTKSLPVDKDNIVIKNNKSVIKLSKGGTVNINGAKVTDDGDYVTSDGISLRNHQHNKGPKPDPV